MRASLRFLLIALGLVFIGWLCERSFDEAPFATVLLALASFTAFGAAAAMVAIEHRKRVDSEQHACSRINTLNDAIAAQRQALTDLEQTVVQGNARVVRELARATAIVRDRQGQTPTTTAWAAPNTSDKAS